MFWFSQNRFSSWDFLPPSCPMNVTCTINLSVSFSCLLFKLWSYLEFSRRIVCLICYDYPQYSTVCIFRVTGLLHEDVQMSGLDSHLPLAWGQDPLPFSWLAKFLQTLLHNRLIPVYPREPVQSPWRCRRWVPPKRRHTQSTLHGLQPQETTIVTCAVYGLQTN